MDEPEKKDFFIPLVRQDLELKMEHKKQQLQPSQYIGLKNEIGDLTPQLFQQHIKIVNEHFKSQMMLQFKDGKETNQNITIKRPPNEKSYENSNLSNDKTSCQIRMKILLQNRHLKSSIEHLREDIQTYRSNQIKIAAIVRESKLKIINYKERLKEKSKRITELTEANIELKQEINKRQEKIHHISTYSDWQETQIRQYQSQVLQQKNENQQCGKLKIKIQQLQFTLKENQRQFGHNVDNHQSEKSIGIARSHVTNQVILLSTNAISQNHEDRWVSVKEMSMAEVELMRQRQANDEEYEQLAQINENLNTKVVDLSQVIQKMKEQILIQQSKWKQQKMLSEQRETQLRMNIEELNTKWKKISYQLQEKNNNIIDLSRQLQQAREQALRIEEQQSTNSQKLQKTISNLQEIIDRQEGAMLQLKQRWQQRQNNLKKELAEVMDQLSSQEEKYVKDINDVIETNCRLKKQIQIFQKLEEQNSLKLQELEILKEENQEKIREAFVIISEKKHFQDLFEELQEENQMLVEQVRDKQLLEEKLHEAENYIEVIEYQKYSNNKDMERKTEQINQIKGQINSLNNSIQRSNMKRRPNRPRTMMIERPTDILSQDKLESVSNNLNAKILNENRANTLFSEEGNIHNINQLRQQQSYEEGTTKKATNHNMSKFMIYAKLPKQKQKEQQSNFIQRAASFEREITILQQLLSKQKSTNSQLCIKLQSLASLNKTIQKEKQSLIEANNELNILIDRLKNESRYIYDSKAYLPYESRIDIQLATRSILTEGTDQIQEKLFELTEEKNQLEEAIMLLTNECKGIKVENVLLQQEITQLRLQLSKVDEAKTEISNMQTKHKTAVDRYEARIKQMQSTIEQSQSQIQTIKEEYDLKINKFSREVADYKQLLEQTQKDNYFHQQKLKQFDIKNDLIIAKEEEIKKLREYSYKLKDELKQMRTNFESIEEQKNQWLSSSQKQRLYINEYQEQIQMLQVELKSLKTINFQLTQRNYQLSETVQNLRRDIMFKSNELFESHEIIEKINKNSQSHNAKSQVSSSVNNTQLIKAFTQINKLTESNLELKQREQALQAHLREKVNVQRQLREKFQGLIGKDEPLSNKNIVTSSDSFPGRSNIFNSQRSQNLYAQLESAKLKLQSAEAYIAQLEDQCQKTNHLDHKHSQNQNDKKQGERESESQKMKLKIEYLEAYVNHLEAEANLKSSTHSKSSSIYSQKHREQQKKFSQADKITLICDFIENSSKDPSFAERGEEVKILLANSSLQKLFNVILCKFEKENTMYRGHQQTILQLQQENHIVHEEIQAQRQNCTFLEKKLQYLENIEKKFKQTQKLLEQTLFQKMKNEAEISDKKTYMRILEERINKIQESMNAKEDDNPLYILQEENQSQYDSKKSDNGDSELPSSDFQFNQIKSDLDRNRYLDIDRNYEGLDLSEGIMRMKNGNISDDKFFIQFLKKCLVQIDELQRQVSDIQQKIQQTSLLLKERNKVGFLTKLSQIQETIKSNDKEMKNHFERSELQLIALVKDILQYQQQQDQYGQQSQSRKKIGDYLNLLEQTQNEKLSQQKLIESQDQFNIYSLRKNTLHQIKEDINEEKGSSIIIPLGQLGQGFNSQSIDINQLKINYKQIVRKLHSMRDELLIKDNQLRGYQQLYSVTEQEVIIIMDEIRTNYQENPYLFNKVKNIQQLLTKFQDQSPLLPLKLKEDRNVENIKNTKEDNPLEALINLEKEQLQHFSNILGNKQLEDLKYIIQSILDERFEDCLNFLNEEKSLVADILKIEEEQKLVEYLNELASRLSKQEVSDIINHSQTRLQANLTFNQIIKQKQKQLHHIPDQQIFSPNGDKLEQIYNRIFDQHTQHSLSLHNQLLAILGSPNQHNFYESVEDFYKLIKIYQQKEHQQLNLSQNHSLKIKQLFQQSLSGIDFQIVQRFDRLELKNQKNRSNSHHTVNDSFQYN